MRSLKQLVEDSTSAIEREFADLKVVCISEQSIDAEFGDETTVVRVLGVPRQDLVAVEDRAYGIVSALLPEGQDVPFTISTQPIEDSQPGGPYFEDLMLRLIQRCTWMSQPIENGLQELMVCALATEGQVFVGEPIESPVAGDFCGSQRPIAA